MRRSVPPLLRFAFPYGVALLLLGIGLCAWDRLVAHGTLHVAVTTTPAAVGQRLAVTVTNGTQHPATYRVNFTPTMDGREVLARSDAFEVR